jgi:NhaP-type Na+/H+ or K+/H+ antiporter
MRLRLVSKFLTLVAVVGSILYFSCHYSLLLLQVQEFYVSAALTHLCCRRLKHFAVLGLSTTIFQLSHYLDAEPLLACVTMGMVAVNRRHDRMEKEKEELHGMLAQIMGLSNVAFFGLAGASLKLVRKCMAKCF